MFVLMNVGAFFYIAGIIACFVALFKFDNDKWTAIFFSIFTAGGILMVTCFSIIMASRS